MRDGPATLPAGLARNTMPDNPISSPTETVEAPPAGVSGRQSHGPPANWRVGFWTLIATQFQGAFNDNALKFLVIYLIVERDFPAAMRDRLVLLVGALFALPYILFSLVGGYLADRYSKRSVTIGTKIFEIGVMIFALVALAAGNLPMEAAAVFLISTQGALFGPSKYGLLPELLPEKELSWGNGVIELGTFIAAITATMGAGFLAVAFRGRQTWSGVILLAFTLTGLLMSFGISRVPAADPARRFRTNPFADFGGQLRIIGRDRVLAWAVAGNTYLWFLAALLQFVIVIYGHDVLRVDETQISYLQAAVGIGIGVGSLTAGYLSGGKIEYGLIPLGAIGMTIFGFLVSQHGLGVWPVRLDLALLGFFGGFYAVPLNALIQHRPAPEQKGGVIAAANLLSFVGVFIAAGLYFLFSSVAHLQPGQIFLAGAIMTLGATFYAAFLLPDSLLRLVLWMLTHSLYRIRVQGRDNIPERGGALLVANHMSWVDALLLIASTDRSLRFLMYEPIYRHPVIHPFARSLGCIPISSEQRPRDMVHSLRAATNAIEAGGIVCIFAEGQMTRIGQMLPFRHGFERIMKGVDAPIIPVSLDNVWGSIFSFERGRYLWKLPRHVPYPVTVSFGSPLPPRATAFEVRQAVQELQTAAYIHRKKRMRTLGRLFLDTARRHPLRFAMADARVPAMRFHEARTRSIFLARRLKSLWAGQRMVGILLPPSVAGALVNFAAVLSGKVPVNLNYTASGEILASCARQCEIETVVTSRAFLERVNIEVPAKSIFVEDLAPRPRFAEKVAALAMSWLFPARLLERALGQRTPAGLDDLATVIFSSGSTGDPKGVLLSHFNLASNIDQVSQTFMLRSRDRVLGVLPFFHSFGFTVTLWLPAARGVGVIYHPNPLDLAAISEIARKYKITFLLATPTFLQAYLRRCSPEDFGSMQLVMVGAEKLPERLAQAFEDRFGIRPFEGYGCTECSPVVAVNTRDFRAPGFRQTGAKRGKIGHPLPGVSVRIADPETLATLPLGQSGVLLVAGPNVMQGYLGRPEKSAEVLREGWYVTGDIAALDEDGFIEITDRLSRFSKIGGEMVPHIKIEEKLHELAEATEQTFVVTGVPDEKKGERLVVLHTLSDDRLKSVLEKLGHCDLPNLWLPRPNQFFRATEFPHLGTGKLDLRRIRELALSLTART
jgi:acyl-[acyl-carrier-protein]-phospholipid O-acyltransferase/long-chain-fatty-acid--[acyl-carrier-protein] ligase